VTGLGLLTICAVGAYFLIFALYRSPKGTDQ
jgi:hypothetical protein